MYISNKISRIFSLFAHMKFPKCMQIPLNRFYVRLFKINLSDFDSYDSYDSLNALFTRELRIKRTLENKEFNLISPTDSLIMESGVINNNTSFQIKNKKYNVLDFIGSKSENLNDFKFINLYLSPKDYHHYHAPCDLEILEARYFSGKLLPVNKKSLLKNNNLFIQNERVVLKIRILYNKSIAYYVAVGALNVGKMNFCFDKNIQTNASWHNKVYSYEKPIVIKCGDKIGYFEMGSTIVFIAKANWTVTNQQEVKMGQEIGTISTI